MAFDFDLIQSTYKKLVTRVDQAKKILGRPMTLTEKILYAHLYKESDSKNYSRGTDYAEFAPDRVAMQDATAQMALLQFMLAGKTESAVPATVHADHLIQAKTGAAVDLKSAQITNKEVFDFLESVSARYGIGFWKPGAGIIHQVVLENYAFPGGMMIGTDSHTPNAGGLGMLAVGVGGADAVDAMVGLPWELKFPKIIGVRLTGSLKGFAAPKDIILKLAGILTVKGGTGAIVEYFGEGSRNISCTGKATICNMGAEIGATCSTFSFDDSMGRYLRSTDREDVASAAEAVAEYLKADPEVEASPEKYYDQVIEINLDELGPHWNGPFSPDRAWPVDQMSESLKEFSSSAKVSAALIGSCTNSSYEDLTRAASILKQANAKGLKPKAQLIINPGSEQVRYTAERDGLLDIFTEFGAVIMSNACGPCIGQWDRPGADKQEVNTIVHSFNRNFSKRADGNPNTHAFVGSPESVAIAALSGDLTFNPLTDSLTNEAGESVTLDVPQGTELPPAGFAVEDNGFLAPPADRTELDVIIDPQSQRLQKLEPFAPWDGEDICNCRVLIKAKGKCTTDHISMAGPWLRFRGHLQNISNNCLIGAVNAYSDQVNKVKNMLTGEITEVPKSALAYKEAGVSTVVVGDENYGEGSSREHAAMEPRFLGVRAVLVKSFARIHETNLKKQGMLALTFANPADYDKIREDDKLCILGLPDMQPGKDLMLRIEHSDGEVEEIEVCHTYNEQQIGWFRAGSALNLIRSAS